MTLRLVADPLLRRPWLPAYAVAALLWLLIIAFGQVAGGFGILSAALQFATFYAIVGLGQMLVIAAGPGNIDLSIPGVMVLSAFVAVGVMEGSDSGLAAGIVAGLLVGLAAGMANAALIRLLEIPPMIATLASGFVLLSIASATSGLTGDKPSPLLIDLMATRIFGVPLIALAVVAITALIAQTIVRGTFGRAVLAIGQSPRAAHFAGFRVGRTLTAVYVISAVMASLSGMALAVFTGGAALNMASDFLLMSIAVVVLGGTAVSGGQASPAGIWGAALLLQLLVTLLNVLGAPSGIRHAATGAIIIAVLAITSRRRTG